MNIVDRRKDILRHPTIKTPLRSISDIKGIVIHHSLTKDGSADAFARYHVLTNGWSCMGYTYSIKRDGTIEWCADWNAVTPHVGNSNRYYLGICMVGDFREQEPTKEQYASLYELIAYLMKELKLSPINILGHQEMPTYSWKQCPALDMDALRGNIQAKHYVPVKNNFDNDTKIEIDVPQMTNVIPTDVLTAPLWNGTELKNGQIGRLTILKPINLWKRLDNGKLEMVRVLNPNESYRVYSYDQLHGGQYNVGGLYVTKMEGYILYETPSRQLLQQAQEYYKNN